MFLNSKKLILCVTNKSLIAGLWHGTSLRSYSAFHNDDEGHTAFGEYLAQFGQINIYLIADAIEEEYRLEVLPHTSGSARREIIERKLSQFSRSNEYRTAHFINRASDKRKDDSFLFVALSNAEFLQGWISAIQANQAPLVGVYLLPMISQVIVRQMKLMAPNILLCERLSSGLRQTYLHNGRLRMSRLAPMEDVKPNQLAFFYLMEIDKTRLYLLSQRLIENETSMQMVLPAIDNTHEEIAKSISQDQDLECKAIDILAYAKSNHIAPDLVKQFPELLHMQLLANGNVPDNLAPAPFTKAHNLKNMRSRIGLSTACIVFLGSCFAGFYFWQGLQLKNQTEQIIVQTAQQQQSYDEVAKNFPVSPISSADLEIATELAKIIKNNAQTPRQFMQIISTASEASKEITLTRMRWVLTNDINIKDKDDRQNQGAQPITAPASDPTKLMQVGFVNAEIQGFTGDYRAALASVSQLVVHLRENSQVEQVQILQEPVNVSSLASLQGSTTDAGTAERTPAIFKLKVVLKPISQVNQASNRVAP